ncbi:MAG TPA: hypothetical protein VIE16_10445 [Phenylobacterium sp.]|jgi:hypothetical protein
MTDASEDPFVAGTANLRETTKWLVGGMISIAVGVLAGSPLTNLGALDAGPRLATALAGAAVAYAVLGVLLWRALGVVAAETTSFSAMVAATGPDAAAARRIEARMSGLLPQGCSTFAELSAASARITADTSRGSTKRYDDFSAEVKALGPQLAFEFKRDRFVRLRRLIFALAPLVVAGVGLFAWAANPPAPRTLTDSPRYSQVTLDAASAAMIAQAQGQACHGVLHAGTVLRVLIVQEDEGRSQIVTLPAEPGCAPVRLVQQNGRIFLRK